MARAESAVRRVKRTRSQMNPHMCVFNRAIVQPRLHKWPILNSKQEKKCKRQLSGGGDTSSSAQHSKEVVWLVRISHALTSIWEILHLIAKRLSHVLVGLADRRPYVCSRYKRVFSVGTHGITTYNPTTLEVTNQVRKCSLQLVAFINFSYTVA